MIDNQITVQLSQNANSGEWWQIGDGSPKVSDLTAEGVTQNDIELPPWEPGDGVTDVRAEHTSLRHSQRDIRIVCADEGGREIRWGVSHHFPIVPRSWDLMARSSDREGDLRLNVAGVG